MPTNKLHDIRYGKTHKPLSILSSTIRGRKSRNTTLQQNGKRAVNVHRSKFFFITHYDARDKYRTFLQNVDASRNRHINDINSYSIRKILEQGNDLDLNMPNETTKFITESISSLSYDLSAFIEDYITDHTTDNTKDLIWKDHLHCIISERKVKKMELSDIKKSVCLLIDDCKTPKHMQAVHKIIIFLVEQNYLPADNYRKINKEFKKKARNELEKMLEKLAGDQKDESLLSEDCSFFEILSKINGYKNLLLERRHNYFAFRRYVTSKTKLSRSESLLHQADKATVSLLELASEKIRSSCKIALYCNKTENITLDCFVKLAQGFRVSMFLVADESILNTDRVNFERYVAETSTNFISCLTRMSDTFIKDEQVLQIIQEILAESENLNAKQAAYPDIKKILAKKHPDVMKKISDKIKYNAEVKVKKSKQPKTLTLLVPSGDDHYDKHDDHYANNYKDKAYQNDDDHYAAKSSKGSRHYQNDDDHYAKSSEGSRHYHNDHYAAKSSKARHYHNDDDDDVSIYDQCNYLSITENDDNNTPLIPSAPPPPLPIVSANASLNVAQGSVIKELQRKILAGDFKLRKVKLETPKKIVATEAKKGVNKGAQQGAKKGSKKGAKKGS